MDGAFSYQRKFESRLSLRATIVLPLLYALIVCCAEQDGIVPGNDGGGTMFSNSGTVDFFAMLKQAGFAIRPGLDNNTPDWDNAIDFAKKL